MSASEVRATYEELSTVARRFVQASEKHQQDLQRVQQASTRLHRQGWEGKGSDAFFQEMERVVLPAMRRLCTALAQGGTTVQKIQTVMRNAEEEAARLFQGQSSSGAESMPAQGGGGGGDGTKLTEGQDVFSDEVNYVGPLSTADVAAISAVSAIEAQYGVQLAFPTQNTDDMPRFPNGTIPDAAKPQLRTASAADATAIAQVEVELAALSEYGVRLTQNGDAHWTPQEIHQIYVAVTAQAEAAHARATELGLIDPTKVTPQQVFKDVYTVGEFGIKFTRDSENLGPGGSFAYKDENNFTLYDAAFYAEQITGGGKSSGLAFTPSLLIQHEISHQINAIHLTVQGLGGQTPMDYYYQQFNRDLNGDDVPDYNTYTFKEDRTILYYDEGIRIYTIQAGDTISRADFTEPGWESSDMGYNFRARSAMEGTGDAANAYNGRERMTDGHLAEILGDQGYAPGYNSLGQELWAVARDEVNSYIFDSVLNQVYGK